MAAYWSNENSTSFYPDVTPHVGASQATRIGAHVSTEPRHFFPLTNPRPAFNSIAGTSIDVPSLLICFQKMNSTHWINIVFSFFVSNPIWAGNATTTYHGFWKSSQSSVGCCLVACIVQYSIVNEISVTR
mmetsp:Transcript_63060/g.176374  ORF Transcript_63060/g.176374 Transcript_63060/m.176374 type:complete len:130 (-) Transcript_63060:188-577(-)